MKKKSSFEELWNPKTLFDAWKVIYKNSMYSKSDSIVSNAIEYDKNSYNNISKLSRQIKEKTFKFPKALGYMEKGKRPLVVADINTRIIQRALLDILVKRKKIKKYLEVETSFGAIPTKSVKDAIELVCLNLKKGNTYFIRSDIKKFFTKVDRNKVMREIAKTARSKDFLYFLDKVTNLEIKNLEEIPDNQKKLFKFEKEGTPQGCCLSPLFANIFLYDFDVTMNTKDVTMVRYLDDFLIMAPNQKILNGAFKKSKRVLKQISSNLDIYDPNNAEDKEKAEIGNAITKRQKISFLGIGIKLNSDNTKVFLEPFAKSYKKTEQAIKNKLILSIKHIEEAKNPKNIKYKYSILETLYRVNNIIKGWAKQYKRFQDISSENEKELKGYMLIDTAWIGSKDANIRNIIKKYMSTLRKKKNSSYILGVYNMKDDFTMIDK